MLCITEYLAGLIIAVHLYFMTSAEACAACYTETLLNLTGDGEFIWPWIL